MILFILKLIPVFQMGGEVGTPSAHPRGLPVRQGRGSSRGLAHRTRPLSQVGGARRKFDIGLKPERSS